jgi:hypothetical protein
VYPNCTIVSNIDPFFSRMSPVNLFPIISQCDCYLPKLITHVQSPWVAIGNHLITLASGWYPGLWHVNHDSWTNLKYWQWAKSIKLMLSRWVWSMFQLYWYSCFFCTIHYKNKYHGKKCVLSCYLFKTPYKMLTFNI